MEAPNTIATVNKPEAAAHPPVFLRLISPTSDEIASQIQPAFAEKAKLIAGEIPHIKPAGESFFATTRSGAVVKLDEPSQRKKFAEIAVGDYWELMNIADLIFHWNKSSGSPVFLELETTDYSIKFHDYESCSRFLSEMEDKWEEWGDAGNGHRRPAVHANG